MTQKPNDKFKLLTVGGLAELSGPDWLIEGMVPVRGFVNLYRPPKSGKSFIALDWGLSIAIGVPWLGHEVRTGPVVYVYAETPSDLKARVPPWCMAHDVSPLEFLMLPARVNITDAGERHRLVRTTPKWAASSMPAKACVTGSIARSWWCIIPARTSPPEAGARQHFLLRLTHSSK
jgi:AAA domain